MYKTPFTILELINLQIEPLVQAALLEDIGTGDVTTLSVVPPGVQAEGRFLAKAPGVLCGLSVAETAFRLLDASVSFQPILTDSAHLDGTRELIATVTGDARVILTGERVALNFMQRLSGVATLAAQFAEAVRGTNARIVDTRKTTPGLRVLEKYAVRVGGAYNHRFGLSDGVLIKDNHIVAAGGVRAAIEAARRFAPHTLRIEVEAKELGQVQEALAAKADIILLDNMSLDTLREAVALVDRRALTEASGGVNLNTVRAIAETGVDLISVGAMTHSAVALDISLDFTGLQ